MSFAPYPAYRDCGVAWLGPLPRGWSIKRVKHVTRSIEQGWSPQCDGFPVASTEEWGVLKVGCVNGGRFNPEENKALPAELTPIPELRITAGDVLISRANTRELVGGAVCVSADHPNLLLCDKLYRLRLNDGVCLPQWLAVYLRSDAARGQIELAASGASQSMVNIGQGTILDLPMPLPARDEQSEILAFLDRETGKIDALVAEQERLIALLKEKRQAVISQVVTKGLDASVPMKDSGVAWLGQVPAHWEVKRVKHVTRSIEQGWSPQCDGFPVSSDDEWGVLKVGCVNGGRFNPEENKSLPAELPPIPDLGVAAGDVLISRANTRELVGGAACVSVDHRNLLLCDKLYRLRLDDAACLPEWLAIYLRTDAARGQIELAASGASQSMVNIGQGTILDLPIPLPPAIEQRVLVEKIEARSQDIDTLTAEASRAMALLRERRAALISATVTGKIDVRGVITARAPEAA